MSDHTDIRQSIASAEKPSPTFALAAFAGLPLGGLAVWAFLQAIFEAPAALLMFLVVVAAILAAETRIAQFARGLTPPPALKRILYPARRIRLAQAFAYAPLFAFCFVRDISASAIADWIGGYLLVFGLMFAASEASAAAVRLLRVRNRRRL